MYDLSNGVISNYFVYPITRVSRSSSRSWYFSFLCCL